MSNSFPAGRFDPHRVVIEAVGTQDSGERGPEIRQPPGLGVDSRVRTSSEFPDAARVRAVVLAWMSRWRRS